MSIEIRQTGFEGLLVIKPKCFKDNRGWFLEAYNYETLQAVGIDAEFVQENQAFSKRNVLRGLHYQVGDNAQGKLIRAIHGRILDVAVDIRWGSPTYGKHYKIVLSGHNNLQLWIPSGFAHGALTLSSSSVFTYFCTKYYSPADARVIVWNDPDLNIDWGITQPVLTEADAQGIHFSDINKDFLYR